MLLSMQTLNPKENRVRHTSKDLREIHEENQLFFMITSVSEKVFIGEVLWGRELPHAKMSPPEYRLNSRSMEKVFIGEVLWGRELPHAKISPPKC